MFQMMPVSCLATSSDNIPRGTSSQTRYYVTEKQKKNVSQGPNFPHGFGGNLALSKFIQIRQRKCMFFLIFTDAFQIRTANLYLVTKEEQKSTPLPTIFSR